MIIFLAVLAVMKNMGVILMYNVKIKYYCSGDSQVSVHSRLILTGKRKEKDAVADTLAEETELTLADEDARHQRSVQNSMKRSLGTIYDISRSNEWEYFVTLTFSPEKVDRYNYSLCSAKLSQWLKDIRKRVGSDFCYLVVPERHKDGAFHFHGLFANCDGLDFSPSGHFDDSGRIIFNIGSYHLGFTTATAVSNNESVTKYLTKYVTKELVESTRGKKRYWASRNCLRPIEETFCFDVQGKGVLCRELVEDVQYYKACEYNVNSKDCLSEYFENKYLTINAAAEEVV